ncbi:unnamed protein product [Effrenium voratum]|uniref:Uncharacterized protein n=1 Tax=Effrenium voratum TaxID=2562239 RepID=A0AA36J2L8_9DINO|nr:unnamed protein product [Effrenium voratum]
MQRSKVKGEAEGPARFRGAGVMINRVFEARVKQLHVTGQRHTSPRAHSPRLRPQRPEVGDAISRPDTAVEMADQEVHMIQPWFNLLAPCRDSLMGFSMDEVKWSQSPGPSREFSVRSRTGARSSLTRTPMDSRAASAESSRPPSCQVPLLPRPKLDEGTETAAAVWPPGSARWRRLQVVRRDAHENQTERQASPAPRISKPAPSAPSARKPRTPGPRSRRWWEL